MNKKIVIILSVIAVVMVGAVIVSISLFGGQKESVKAAPNPVATHSSTPKATPTGTRTESIADHAAKFVENHDFKNGATSITVGGVTKDCGAETPPVEGAELHGYSIDFADEAHTQVVTISCLWSGAAVQDAFGLNK